MLEKRLAAVTPQLFIANGGADGKITVADSSLFKVKQQVTLTASTLQPLDLEVKRVTDSNTIYVGPIKGNIDTRENITIYTIALGSIIFANEQKRPSIPQEEIIRATYEEEPTVAERVILVDKFGNKYEPSNPFPVRLSDGSVNIGTVNAELEVQLSHKNNTPNIGDVADSVRIGNGINEAVVNSDGSMDTYQRNKLIATAHDTIIISASNPSGDPTQILFKKGGISGNTVQTLNLTYDIAGNFASVTRTPNEN